MSKFRTSLALWLRGLADRLDPPAQPAQWKAHITFGSLPTTFTYTYDPHDSTVTKVGWRR